MRPDAPPDSQHACNMNIEIRATNVEVSAALEEHVTKTVRAALRPQRDSVVRVVVRICDLNGPEGGRDIHCHVIARLRGRSMVVHDLAGEPFAAVSQAAARLGELMTSVIERHRISRDGVRYVTSVTRSSDP